MAKLEIYEGQNTIQQSATPQTSTLALPFSLATNKGKAISSFAKVVGTIQSDLHKIEDENQAQEVLPGIIIDISKKYSELSKSSDIINGPKDFQKVLDYKNYENKLKKYNKNVQRLIRTELGNQTITMMPKLVNAISSNVVDKALINIDTKLNEALLHATSDDAALIAKGSIDFDTITNNKAYETLVGAKDWKAYTDKKKLQLAELQITQQIKLNPTSLIKNKKALVKMVGPDLAKELVEKARVGLISKTNEEERRNILEEVYENDTKMGAFVELIERVNRAKNNSDLESEVPSISQLYDAMNDGVLNQVMFNQLVGVLKGEDKLSDEELHEIITVAIYSAESIEMMDDIKKAMLLDDNVLRSLDIKDITLFTAIIDRAKKNFPAHKDFKVYSKLIDANLKNLTNIRTGRMLKFAQAIDTKKVLIKQAYSQKVLDGMTPQNAYLSVLANEMDINAIPQLSNVAPGFLRDVKFVDAVTAASKNGENFFENQNKVVYERFNGSIEDGKKVKGHGNIKKMQQELEQLDFMQKLFEARLAVAPGDKDADKLAWALEGGLGYSKLLEAIKEGK